eukprot:GILI01002402.1.p1 GENE.GILI01002402.1~~GILI01002402.1.p1  ORF type:complete len:149 (+),score=45.92 GILI01002402.1:143-589(+)
MKLTSEEIEKCKQAFEAFDKDGSGTIDCFELRVVLEAMGQNPTDEEIFQMMSEVDDDMSGQIDFAEFLKVIEKQKQSAQDCEDETDLIDAFVSMGGNPDKSGKVDAEKLIRVIKHEFGLTIDIEGLIRSVDTDRSGSIEFDEFKLLLT